MRGVRGAIDARDGGVDGRGDVEETDAARQLDCGGDGGVGLRDAVEGCGEAAEEFEGLARTVVACRGRAARGGASGDASGAHAEDGVAGASGGSGAFLG